MKTYISLLAFTGLLACAQSEEQGAQLASQISSPNGDAVCDTAGIDHLPQAESYRIFFGAGDRGTWVSSNGLFAFDAPFAHEPNQVVNAYANYEKFGVVGAGKVATIRYTGGIANLHHTKEDFAFYFGYKVDGEDQWKRMEWDESPSTTYTGYTLEWVVPQSHDAAAEVWFEARYTEDGEERVSYDSNNGQNFKIHVTGQSTRSICFSVDWNEAFAGGTIAAGDSVEIVYDVERLLDRMLGTTYASWPAWSAYMHFTINDRSGATVLAGKLPLFAHANSPRNGASSTKRPSYKPVLKIPQAAAGGEMIMWFEGPNRGPTVWDSDFANNYRIAID